MNHAPAKSVTAFGFRMAVCSTARSLSDSIACATHPVLSGPAVERLAKSSLDELIVTDTIPLRADAARLSILHVLSVAPLLGEAIRRTHDEASISSLFI